MLNYKDIYTAAVCNSKPECLEWDESGLVIFGASNAVVVMDPEYNGACKILKTYVEHTNRIINVKLIKNSSLCEEKIISGGSDGKVILWNLKDLDYPKLAIIKPESKINLMSVEGIFNNYNKEIIIAVTTWDMNLEIYNYNLDTKISKQFQNIKSKKGYSSSMLMSLLPITNRILLFCSKNDYTIDIFITTKNSNTDDDDDNEPFQMEFKKVSKLYGYDDFINALDIVQIDEKNLLLATGSNDHFIRIWSISIDSNNDVPNTVNDNIEKLLNENDENFQYINSLFTNIKEIELIEKITIRIRTDTVLYGHEGWVYALNWNKKENEIYLLSSSIDNQLLIWSQNEEGMWIEKYRFGDVSGNKRGYCGGKFSKNGKNIIGYSFDGDFHLWKQSDNDENEWKPQFTITGHRSSVTDLEWENYGNFLYSASEDQTVRIHVPYINKNHNNMQLTWHEIARAQIHGYLINSIAPISRFSFVSAAEEKVIRAFHATANFIENLRNICEIEIDDYDSILNGLPLSVVLQPLSLTNRPVYANGNDSIEDSEEYHQMKYFTPDLLNKPPTEEYLKQNTLWVEIKKLYGHGDEVYTVCTSPNYKFLASASKAKCAKDAKIIIWNISEWKIHQELQAHQLTVTQMKFSPNGKYLLSVSRDRCWTLFEIKIDNKFEKIASSDKNNSIHQRIIWSCDWSYNSKLFCTVSRDSKVVIWHETDKQTNTSLGKWQALSILDLNKFKFDLYNKNKETIDTSITAVAFCPFNNFYNSNEPDSHLIAIGLESGHVVLFKFYNLEWLCLNFLGKTIAHHKAVNKLQFRPNCSNVQLASCGKDNFLRIHEFTFENKN